MDLAGWLQAFGLERSEATFRENAMDEAVLPISRRMISAGLAFRLECGSSC